ncbi:MAG: RnfABCDGE type electron transport complex subunit B [Desulfobacteraceae bacterium]|nr:RnfABCDGE type electron transport complex subunit B [Desulfobacteraceae bacterium]
MYTAIMIMGGLGIIVGIGLALASKIFYVYVDPLVLKVDEELPGANCGGCGLPGCSANAEAIVAGKAAPNSCVAAGPETAEAIAAILGVSVEAREPDIALPGCTYGVADADVKFAYDGMTDCRAVSMLGGGMKVCNIGCIGLGTCERTCLFDAITMGPNGLPVVNEKRCTGCGACERVCPKHIITLSSVTRRIIREYTTEICTTPCQRTCPAGIDICEYIRQIDNGDYHRAVQVIKERNPFPAVIGRICPRPCENECRRKFVDEPVAINFLKRFAADYERKQGKRILPYKAPETGHRIAVVGGGVQGLSTAFFSARLGHSVTVFEATDRLGGLLRTAISAQRLPREVLDWDIDGVLEMGVKAETGQMMGRDFTIDALLEKGFSSVFLAGGGWDSRLTRGVRAEAPPIPGTRLLVDYWRSDDREKPPHGDDTAYLIVGGGTLAVETASDLIKSGARSVTLMFREAPHKLEVSPETIDALEQMGATMLTNCGITRFFGKKNKLKSVEYLDLGTNDRNRMPADVLLFAAGRYPEMIFTAADDVSGSGEDTTGGPMQWEAFLPYKAPAHATETGIFADGDVLTDYSGAIVAIAAGRRAAASIHKSIYDINLDLPDTLLTPTSVVQDVDAVADVSPSSRNIMPLADTAPLLKEEELEKGFSEETARIEAKRCLKCGLICYQRTGEETGVQIRSTVNA